MSDAVKQRRGRVIQGQAYLVEAVQTLELASLCRGGDVTRWSDMRLGVLDPGEILEGVGWTIPADIYSPPTNPCAVCDFDPRTIASNGDDVYSSMDGPYKSINSRH